MFPFNDDPRTACIVCNHVLNKEEPITYITHDEDGMWQFLCGKEHTTDDARIVSLEEVYALDLLLVKWQICLVVVILIKRNNVMNPLM